MQKEFSKKEALTFGWETIKKNFLFFAGLVAAISLISIIPSMIGESLAEDAPFASFVVNVVGLVVSMLAAMGLIKISLQFVDGAQGKWDDLLAPKHLFLNYVAGTILYGLIVIAGFILLIIPGIIWSIQFRFYRYAIIDKGLGPIEALKRSSDITRGTKWNLFLLGILFGLINLAGMLAFVIGLFVTIPVTMVAAAYVYRKLLSQTETTLPENIKV